MSKSTALEDQDMRKEEHQCRNFKVKVLVLAAHKGDSTNKILRDAYDQDQTIVFTDQNTSYVNIANCMELDLSEKSSEETTKETLKWVDITIRMLSGVLWAIVARYSGNIYSYT